MRTPNFWKSKNLSAYLLYPFSLLYYFGYKLRIFFTKPYISKIPVICIGNVVAGGAGKTPIAIEVGKILKSKKINFAYLSKGYSGCFEGVVKVDNKKHNAKFVGDEPLMLSEIADTYVCKNRKQGLQFLQNKKYKFIVVDDGLQNPSFYKNKSVLVVDSEYGVGNGFVLPAGPLREKLNYVLDRVDLIVVNNNKNKIKTEKPIVYTKLEVINKNDFENKKVIAFAGIARPEKFFKTLEQIKCEIVKKVSFEDHYLYKDNDIEYLLRLAEKNKCNLVTTLKDWVRLSEKYKKVVKYVDIKILFENKNLLEKLW